MGQKHGKVMDGNKKIRKQPSIDELRIKARSLETYVVLDFAVPSVFLGLPCVIWERFILPWALVVDRRGCVACATTIAADTYVSLRLTCPTLYGFVRRSQVWEQVWRLHCDEETIAAWTSLYRVSSQPPKSFRNEWGLESCFSKGQKREDMERTLNYLRNDADQLERQPLNWELNNARRRAIEMWFASLSLDEQMWLMLVLRVPCSTRMSVEKTGPFSVGDLIEIDIHVTPTRRNTVVSLKNGDIGKRCGPDPQDDWLKEGCAIKGFNGDAIQDGQLSPGFFGHGCVSAFSDSLKSVGLLRCALPCPLNADPGRISCPTETVFRTEGRLLYRNLHPGHWREEVRFEKEPNTPESPLVISCANWSVPMFDSAVFIARYCDFYVSNDSSYRHEPDKIFTPAWNRDGSSKEILLDNGQKCPIPMEAYVARSILSNVIHIPIISK